MRLSFCFLNMHGDHPTPVATLESPGMSSPSHRDHSVAAVGKRHAAWSSPPHGDHPWHPNIRQQPWSVFSIHTEINHRMTRRALAMLRLLLTHGDPPPRLGCEPGAVFSLRTEITLRWCFDDSRSVGLLPRYRDHPLPDGTICIGNGSSSPARR